MERNSFKEYSVLAHGVKRRAATDESLVQFFFHLDRVIAWLNEVATVVHNNTSRRGMEQSNKATPSGYF